MDMGEGTEVCTDCGLVTCDLIFGGIGGHGGRHATDPHLEELTLRDALLEWLAIIHQDSGFLVDRVLANLERYVREGRIASMPRAHHARERGVLAFVLWETMCEHDFPRSPREIAHLLDTTASDMQRAERRMGVAPTFCPPSSYVDRACAELSLPFATMEAVKRSVGEFEHLMQRPESIVGAVLLLLHRIIAEHCGYEDRHHEINLTTIEIARTLNVSASSIRNTFNRHVACNDRCREILRQAVV